MIKGNFATVDTSTPGWGTLTSGNGYSGILYWITSGSGAVAFCQKPGGGDNQISMQIDGFFYQNEGRYRLLDTSDFNGTISWSNVTSKPSIVTNPMTGSGYIFTVNNSSGGESGIKIQRGGNTAFGLRVNAGIFYVTDLYSNVNMLQINEYTQGSAATFSGSVYSNSDRRLKKNIQNIDRSSLDDLYNIADKLIKSFEWKASGKASYGFIAQELERYIPEAVSTDTNGIKSVSYDVALSKIIAAILHEMKKSK